MAILSLILLNFDLHNLPKTQSATATDHFLTVAPLCCYLTITSLCTVLQCTNMYMVWCLETVRHKNITTLFCSQKTVREWAVEKPGREEIVVGFYKICNGLEELGVPSKGEVSKNNLFSFTTPFSQSKDTDWYTYADQLKAKKTKFFISFLLLIRVPVSLPLSPQF